MMGRRAPMKRIGSPMISAVIAEPVPWGACTTNHWGRLAIVAPMTHNSQPRYPKGRMLISPSCSGSSSCPLPLFPTAIPEHDPDEHQTHQHLGDEATDGPRPGREQEERPLEGRSRDCQTLKGLDDRSGCVRERTVQDGNRRIPCHPHWSRRGRDVPYVLHGDAHMEVSEGRLD